MEKKRLTSVKTRIDEITKGKYVVQGGLNPNYIISPQGQKLARVRIAATVMDKFLSETGKFAAITIDDGTDTIRVKVFNAVSMFDNIAMGDDIDLIARVKEYNGEVYLVPEIITKIDPNFQLLRELELREQHKLMQKKRETILLYKNQTADMAELARILKERENIDEDDIEAVLNTSPTEQVSESVNNKELILELIAKFDTGQGCDYSELLEASKMPEETIDAIINELLSDGVCFEPRPGKIKKL